MLDHAIHHQQHVVAVTASEASAELLASTLTVHGIRAAATGVDRVYPSVSWAQGYRVAVASDDEAAAEELLLGLTGEDVVEDDDGDTPA